MLFINYLQQVVYILRRAARANLATKENLESDIFIKIFFMQTWKSLRFRGQDC